MLVYLFRRRCTIISRAITVMLILGLTKGANAIQLQLSNQTPYLASLTTAFYKEGSAIPGKCEPPELEDPGESDEPDGEPIDEPSEAEYPLEAMCTDTTEEEIESGQGAGAAAPVWVGTAQTRVQTVRMPTYTTVSLETRYVERAGFMHQGGILFYSLTNTRTGLVHLGSMRLKMGQQIDYRLINPAQLSIQAGDTVVFTPLSTFAFFKLTPLGQLKLAWTPPNYFIPTTHVVR